MGGTREIAPRWLCSALVLCGVLIASAPASAQNTADDAAARKQFERGRAAFEQSDYEQSLLHFRSAYGLSHRGQLQYNIGITATRLQRDEEALVAFQSYLEEVEHPPREQEVRQRIAALEQAIEANKEAERQLSEAAASSDDSVRASSGRKIPRSAIVGSSVLGAVGVAGVAAMGVGLAKSGTCVAEVEGMCVSERATNPWTWVYGAVGVAALAGSVTWVLVSRKRSKEKRTTAWMLTPTGVLVSGSF